MCICIPQNAYVCMCLYCMYMYVCSKSYIFDTYKYSRYIHMHTHTYDTYYTYQYIQYIQYIQIHIIHAIHSIHTDTYTYKADTYTYIHIQYCIYVYVPVSCMYHVAFVCMIIYVHVCECMWMYVYVCIFWHLHSNKDCTPQVLHAQRLAPDSKSTFSFQQNAIDVFRTRSLADRSICDSMYHWANVVIYNAQN